jgi:hypothetical protein
VLLSAIITDTEIIFMRTETQDLSELIVFLKIMGPYYLCSSNGITHTNILIVNGHFNSLSLIYTIEHWYTHSDGSKLRQWRVQVLGQEHHHILPTKCRYKNMFFSRNQLLQLLEPVLFYAALVSTAFWIMYFLFTKDPLERNFFH